MECTTHERSQGSISQPLNEHIYNIMCLIIVGSTVYEPHYGRTKYNLEKQDISMKHG